MDKDGERCVTAAIGAEEINDLTRGRAVAQVEVSRPPRQYARPISRGPVRHTGENFIAVRDASAVVVLGGVVDWHRGHATATPVRTVCLTSKPSNCG